MVSRRITGLAMALAVAVTCLMPRVANAFDGPYCGIYCTYAALKIQCSPVKLEDLLDKRYISTPSGSNVDDLYRAIRDHGGNPQPMSGLGEAALKTGALPVILHVRRPGYQSPFSHWVLYLGSDGDAARVLDPPNRVDSIPFSELLAVWDGTGIVVANTKTAAWQTRAGAWLNSGAIIAVVATGLFVFRRYGRYMPMRLGVGLAVFLGVSIIGSLIFHAAFPTGLIRSSGPAGEVARRHFDPDLPTMSIDEFARFVNDAPSATIVDCRVESNYRHAHVPGAISIPITAGTADRARILAAIPTDRLLIVYCQSEACAWAKSMAGDLHYRGYSRVAVFPGGWSQWSRHDLDRKSAGR